MLTVRYDPFHGQAIADAVVPIFVQGMLHTLKTEGGYGYCIGTALILDELRLQILKGNLKPEDLVVLYNGDELHFTDFAVPTKEDRWPRGMFEYTDDLVTRIVMAQCEKSKRKREAQQ